MPSVATGVGANRIVPGATITAPLGAPSLPKDAERQFRRELVMKGLALLTQKIGDSLALSASESFPSEGEKGDGFEWESEGRTSHVNGNEHRRGGY
jgi:hypothetical protein